MQQEFWHERWRSGQIGFHQGAVDDDLRQHWPALGVRAAGRVLVPLCGKSLDLLWLRDQGHSVIGVELSDIALQAFCMENGIAARRRVSAEFDLYQAERLELLRGDFLALAAVHLGPVAAIYDRASLIALPADQRPRYVEHLGAITAAGTRTLLVTLEYPPGELAGPPFSVTADEVRHLYSRHHAIEELARRDILAEEPRMRARGVSQLTDVCYRITRL